MQYATDLKNDRLQKVIDRIDAGSGNGMLIIGTTGMGTELAHISLAKPSFNPPSAGSMTFAGVPLIDPAAIASGIPAAAIVTDSDGTVWVSGLTVGTDGSGANVIVSDGLVNAGDEFRLEAGTIIHG